MPECIECGGHVSKRYNRVFSDESGTCKCPYCSPGQAYDAKAGIPGTW